jgi:tryptophanyl-tRNA synthetase
MGGRIMSLQNPEKKMSKSDENDNNILGLLDPPDVLIKKIKRAVTDSGADIVYNENRPGLANLLGIYAKLSDKSIDEIVDQFEGKMYSHFKADLGELVVETLRPVQDKYTQLMNDKGYLETVLKVGSDKSFIHARKTLSKVYRKVGFLPKK